jgi:hypothetical protein
LARRDRPLTSHEQAWLHRGQRLAGYATFALGLISVARLWSAAGADAEVWPAVLGAAILLACAGVAIVAGIVDGRVSGGWPTRVLTDLHDPVCDSSIGPAARAGAGIKGPDRP